MNIDLKKLKQRWLSPPKISVAIKASFTVLAAYVCASIIASMSTHFILDSIFAQTKATTGKATGQVDVAKKLNYRDVRKAVLDRNIFNSSGEVPDKGEHGDESGGRNIDMAGQCNNPTLDLKVVGTIYLGGNDSIVSVREANYSQSDNYRVSDYIIGHEGVQVVAIERGQMIVDNNGTKECYKIEKTKTKVAKKSSYKPKEKIKTSTSEEATESGAVVLDSAWVESELGPGFSKIIQSARLVPNSTGDRVNGFKIFAIKSGTLFSKIGLKNGDIIQKVNDTSLEQVEQGFALYQTFQEDQEIVFNIIRSQKPHTITVMIR